MITTLLAQAADSGYKVTSLLEMFSTIAPVVGVFIIFMGAVIFVIIRISAKARVIHGEKRQRKSMRDQIEAFWQEVHNRHGELLRKITHAETNWDALFYTPALSDPSVPETYRMLLAMRHAGNTRATQGDLPRLITSKTDVAESPYPKSVDEFALAWDIAEKNARRLGQSLIPAAERRTIEEIRNLLNLAENSAASDTERHLAYRRAENLIDTLTSIHIPEKARAQLEEHKRKMITAAAEARFAAETNEDGEQRMENAS